MRCSLDLVDGRDIEAYSKADTTLQPVRKYTGHASNVGVSLYLWLC